MADHDNKAGITNADYLLGKLRGVASNMYSPHWYQVYDARYSHHFPLFSSLTIRAMLRDPRIRFGLWLIKGPVITYTKFFSEEESESPEIHNAIVELNYQFPYAVIHEDKEIEKYILNQLNRFWTVGAIRALSALEWGFSGSQVLYKKDSKGRLCFDNLIPYNTHPEELQCLTKNEGIVGFRRRHSDSNYVPIGKGLWHIQNRDRHSYYGESRLLGAHIPWHETWMLGGARDIRRTWFFRNSYDSGEMYYPEGNSTSATGQTIPNEEIAAAMMEAKRTGSHALFPSTRDLAGKQLWEFNGPVANATPQGLMEYVDALRDEELEGIGIPPEVIRSEGNNGLGSATGRMVPYMAFIASLTPVGSDLIQDFRSQVLDNILLPLNNMSTDYEIKSIVPKSMGDQSQAIQEQTVNDSGMS